MANNEAQFSATKRSLYFFVNVLVRTSENFLNDSRFQIDDFEKSVNGSSDYVRDVDACIMKYVPARNHCHHIGQSANVALADRTVGLV